MRSNHSCEEFSTARTLQPSDLLEQELRALRDALFLQGRDRAALGIAEALLEVKRRRLLAAA